jgi:hypothetical protein
MQQQNPTGAGGQMSSASSPVADQAREVARAGTEHVKEIGQTVKDRARREIEAKREGIAGEVEKLAGALERQGGESEVAGPIIDLAATAARRLSATLRERSAEDLFQGITRSPVAVLAGSFALGFLAVRLFKA